MEVVDTSLKPFLHSLKHVQEKALQFAKCNAGNLLPYIDFQFL